MIKARSVVRVVEGSRWNADALLAVRGTPSLLCPAGPEDISADIGNLARPHEDRDAEPRSRLEAEIDDVVEQDPKVKEPDKLDIRISMKDLYQYGYSPDCPKCADLEKGLKKSYKDHSDSCRLRMYLQWQTHDDPKYLKVRH